LRDGITGIKYKIARQTGVLLKAGFASPKEFNLANRDARVNGRVEP
jgi:hypothetical protein